MARSRDDTLAILHGATVGRWPVFGGLPSLTATGLAAAGVRYSEAHSEAISMTRAAASTFEVFGFESAVVPFDLCVEAEALGCAVDFHTDVDGYLPPLVSRPLVLAAPAEGISQADVERLRRRLPTEVAQAGRVPLVTDALRRLQAGVGQEIAIGAWLCGPFTLGWQLFGVETWLGALAQPELVRPLLGILADWLAQLGQQYRQAGADFITVHEMGGSPQAIGPAAFRSLVKPALQRLMKGLPAPRVLSVCGDTNAIITDLAACGADALNVDHRNDLARTRQALGPQAILLGNFDPVGLLDQGPPEHIAPTVETIIAAGANAIWPGCDLPPTISEVNLRTLMGAARGYSAKTQP